MKQRSTFHASPFPTTRWSQIMVAREGQSAAHSALNDLFRKYGRPIDAFARHRGLASHDAEDITQAYFARLLERDDEQGQKLLFDALQTGLVNLLTPPLTRHGSSSSA